MSQSFPELIPADHLIYHGMGFVDLSISLKTGSLADHIEVYTGNGMSVASRNGVGVNAYALRREGLAYVLRPKGHYDLKKGMAWFDKVRGYKYGWTELLNFWIPGKPIIQRKAMICSEFAARLDDASDFQSFNVDWSAHKISPADFLKLACFDWVYKYK